MRDLARIQEQAAAALQAPVLRALETRDALNRALQGPMRDIAQTQARMQRLLEGPLEQIRRNQEALTRALAEPYAAVLRNQDVFLTAMAAAAAAAEVDAAHGIAAEGEPHLVWLHDWVEAITDWAPTAEQARELLNALSFLLAVIALAFALSSPDTLTDELLSAASILFAAGAYVVGFVSRRTGS
jgi:hypothetical protein